MFALLDFSARAFNGGELEVNTDTFLAFPPSTVTTAPEPSSWAMLVVGFAGFGFVRYRGSEGARPSRAQSGLPQSRG
ncbi:MAG: PEP-CTERM sorting domain-containing protein [Stellaceae bacterium]